MQYTRRKKQERIPPRPNQRLWTGSPAFTNEPDSGTNHNISVVGWDDTFSNDNFIPSPDGRKPEHDGAWLIKNSFGTDYANEGGFLYVSYEDAYLFTEEENLAFAVTSIIEPDGLKRYMLDEFGAVNLIEIEKDVFEEAAVYEFAAEETAEKIAFTAGGKGTSFSVYYTPAADGKPSEDQNEWKLLKSGTLDYAGYHTFEIEPLEVKEGEGALILHLEGNDIIIGIEEALTKTGGKPKYFEVLSGRSFMKEENGFISCERDLDENGMAVKHGYDVSLRIFTDGD